MTVRTVRKESRGWTLRDIVLMAFLGVLFGFLYWLMLLLWGGARVAAGPLGDLTQSIFIGLWMTVAPLAIYIIRKPLTGVATEILAAFIEIGVFVNPVGPLLLLTGLVQGAGSELPFALTRYRKFGWGMFALSGLSAATFSFIYAAFRFGWFGQTLPGVTQEQLDEQGLGFLGVVGILVVARLVLHLLSGVLFGGLLAKVIGDALKRTGVLDNFPIGAPEEAQGPGVSLRPLRIFGLALVGVAAIAFVWAGFQAPEFLVFLQAAPEGAAAGLRTVQIIALAIGVIGAILAIAGTVARDEPSPPPVAA